MGAAAWRCIDSRCSESGGVRQDGTGASNVAPRESGDGSLGRFAASTRKRCVMRATSGREEQEVCDESDESERSNMWALMR
jgi:hypothetical protein